MNDKHWTGDITYNMHDKYGNKYRLKIEYDDMAEDPREWDNTATMLCWTTRYDLGDKHNYEDIQEALEDLADKVGVKYDEIDWSVKGGAKARDKKLIEDLMPYYCIKYLYLYDHSGITISTSDFGDPWDSGIVGLIYISKKTAFDDFGDVSEDNWYDKASKCIEAEVECYDMYIRGEVYGYTLEKEVLVEDKCPHCNEVIKTYTEWEHQDSCCGFYGDTLEESGILDYIPEDLAFDE